MADTIFTYGPANVANLLTTTNSKRPRKEAMDAVFNKIPTFEYLNSKGRIMLDGGATVLVPLEVAKNSNAGFYDGLESLPTTDIPFMTTAQYTWKQAQCPVVISGRETEIQNRGESAIINLVTAKQKNAEKSLRDLINRKLHSASNASDEITSLRTLIDATSSIGDINSTTYSYWQGLVTVGSTFASTGVANWRTQYNTLKNRGGNPDMLITTQTIHELYESTMSPQIRYTSLETGETKFKDLKFANANVRFDDQCESGVTYFLDSDVLHLYVHENRNFKFDEFVKPPDQDGRVSHFLVALALGTSNRRLLGKVTTQS